MTYIREIEAAEEAETFTATEARTRIEFMSANSTSGIQWFETNSTVPRGWPTYRSITGTHYITSPPEYIGSYTTSELFRTPYVQAHAMPPPLSQAELRKRNIEHTVATLRQYNLVDQEVTLFVVKNTQRYTAYQCLATEAMLHHSMSMSVAMFDHHSTSTSTRSMYFCLYCTTAQLRNTILAYRGLHDHSSNEYWFTLNATNAFDVNSLNDLRTFLRSL